MITDRFWISWWIGLALFLAGIVLVGAIPGDQSLQGDVLATLWIVSLGVGIATTPRRIWISPMTYWAVALALSFVVARVEPTDLTVAVSLTILFFGLPVALGVLWIMLPSIRSRGAGGSIETHRQVRSIVESSGMQEPHGTPSRRRPDQNSVGAKRGMTVVTAMTLIMSSIAFAAVASIVAWTSGEQAKQQAKVANTNPDSYGPACDAYLSTVTTIEDAMLENFPIECQMELAQSNSRTIALRQTAENTSNRAKIAWAAAGVAVALAALVWFIYHRENTSRRRV
jgi:hypothetical protein